MPAGYEQVSQLHGVLSRARDLAVRTMIFDIEPLVAWWDTSQDSLDQGLTGIVSDLAEVPELEVLVFATNSARRPSVVPVVAGVRVIYLSYAGKPLRTAPYQSLPRPGAVIGDQLHTDGLLAYRLGYTFLHWSPRLTGVPPGPRLMHLLGRLARPLVFRRDARPDGSRAEDS